MENATHGDDECFRHIEALAKQMCNKWEVVEKFAVAWLDSEIELDPKIALTQILREKLAELTVFVRDDKSSEKKVRV